MVKHYLLAAVLLLGGCSALDVITPSGPQVNTNAQVGRENTQQLVGQQQNVQGDMNRDLIEAREGSVTVNNSPIWLIVLLIIGWSLPTPLTMIKGAWRAMPWTKSK